MRTERGSGLTLEGGWGSRPTPLYPTLPQIPSPHLPREQTDACENITFPLRSVMMV